MIARPIVRLFALAILDIVLAGVAMATASVGPALAGHMALTAVALMVWIRGGWRLALAPTIASIAGPVAILMTLAIVRGTDSDRIADAADDDAPAPRSTRMVLRMLDGRVRHATPDRLGSFVTVLRHGKVGDRRRALETVVRSFQPDLSPIVALALTDPDQTIRALAAAASSRIVQNLTLTRTTLEARVAEGRDPQAAQALATLLADHARANVLLSDSQRTHLREDAAALAPDATNRIEALWAAGDYAAIDAMVAVDSAWREAAA